MLGILQLVPLVWRLAALGAAIVAAWRHYCDRRLTSASNLVRNTDGAPAGSSASA